MRNDNNEATDALFPVKWNYRYVPLVIIGFIIVGAIGILQSATAGAVHRAFRASKVTVNSALNATDGIYRFRTYCETSSSARVSCTRVYHVEEYSFPQPSKLRRVQRGISVSLCLNTATKILRSTLHILASIRTDLHYDKSLSHVAASSCFTFPRI